MLIKALLDREVPSGGFPIEVHTVVVNVATTAEIGRLLPSGRGIQERVITITGPVQNFITKPLRSSSPSFTSKVVSLRNAPMSSITMKNLISFWPTATSRAPVRIAAMRKLMEISVRTVALPFHQQS